MNRTADESLIAVFIDFENLAIGLRPQKFDPEVILRRLLEKGRIVYKRAYCDWSGYRKEVGDLHQHGIELVDIPQTRASGKNSADIRMVVDAMDLSHAKEHIDTFALVTGDSDFSPLASKLKENDRRVLGCGVRKSTSDLLVGGCDEFIYYDDLIRGAQERKKPKSTSKTQGNEENETLDRVVEIVRSLERDYETVWGSMGKQTMRRVFPSFNEESHGYTSFTDALENVASKGRIQLELDEQRGNYIVRSVRK